MSLGFISDIEGGCCSILSRAPFQDCGKAKNPSEIKHFIFSVGVFRNFILKTRQNISGDLGLVFSCVFLLHTF
jgi:hypothetical protein